MGRVINYERLNLAVVRLKFRSPNRGNPTLVYSTLLYMFYNGKLERKVSELKHLSNSLKKSTESSLVVVSECELIKAYRGLLRMKKTSTFTSCCDKLSAVEGCSPVF